MMSLTARGITRLRPLISATLTNCFLIFRRWFADEKSLHRHIDPGKSGALAYIEVNDAQITGKVMPFSEAGYRFIIRHLAEEYAGNIVCAVEQVSAMPGQGVTSMFNFGKGFGWILGTLEAYGVPYELIRPQKWKKEFSVTSDKNTSIEVCKRLFPHVSLLPTERCKKDNDGMAEALLMAEYARRKM